MASSSCRQALIIAPFPFTVALQGQQVEHCCSSLLCPISTRCRVHHGIEFHCFTVHAVDETSSLHQIGQASHMLQQLWFPSTLAIDHLAPYIFTSKMTPIFPKLPRTACVFSGGPLIYHQTCLKFGLEGARPNNTIDALRAQIRFAHLHRLEAEPIRPTTSALLASGGRACRTDFALSGSSSRQDSALTWQVRLPTLDKCVLHRNKGLKFP